MPATIDKIKNKYRYRIIIKCKYNNEIIELMNDVLNKYSIEKESKTGNTRVIIDLNPNNWY